MKTYLQTMVEKQIIQSSNRTVFPKNLRNKEQKENTVVFFISFTYNVVVEGGTQQ